MHTDADAADKEDMAALQAGDDLALNRLMGRWELPLKGFLFRYTSNWSVTSDLAQETFVKLYLSRNRYRPKAAFSTWLFAIASNLARNQARWKKRHPGSALSSQPASDEGLTPLDAVEGHEPAPDDSANRSDEARLVRDAVDKLPHDLKAALLLFEYQGLSHREIAEVLGCSEKAIETRLYRSRKQLKEILAQFGLV